MLENINKISIIGGSGTGKTTLSNNLSKTLNLPVYHIDGIHYLKNWQVRNKEERNKIILRKIREEKWIIDGTYRDTLKQRIEAADLVIYLDYSSLAQVKGVIKRYFKGHNKEKPEIPGCKEKMDFNFFVFVLHWRRDKRGNIINNLNSAKNKNVLIFKNQRQLNKWYKKEFGKKMIIK